MDQYNRAYRDHKSPLTPLTPLTNNTFNFEICNDKSTCTPKAAPFVGKVKNSMHKLSLPKLPTSSSSNKSPLHCLPTPKRFSPNFLKVRDVFERHLPISLPMARNKQNCTCNPKSATAAATSSGIADIKKDHKFKQKPKFKQASPIAPKLLSPRVHQLLHKYNLEHLSTLFCYQEIDTEVLRMMTLDDLKSLGIDNTKELQQLINANKYDSDFFNI